MYLSDTIGENFKNWDKGFIFLNAGTGCGKTHFIMNDFLAYAQKQNKSILLLTNRTTLNNQISTELHNKDEIFYSMKIKEITNSDFIEEEEQFSLINHIQHSFQEHLAFHPNQLYFANLQIQTYQSFEQDLLYKRDRIKSYDYIICDEAHYFFDDSLFNPLTFVSYRYIMHLGKNKKSTVILMSASAWYLEELLLKKGLLTETEIYSVPKDYSYIKNIYMYRHYQFEQIVSRIFEHDKNARILIFSNSPTCFKKIAEKFAEISCFIASPNSTCYNYAKDNLPLGEIHKHNNTISFNPDKKILITTSKLDNGVNIKDDSIQYIICDFDDISSLTQAIGRKRVVSDNDTCDIYIQYHDELNNIETYKSQYEAERLFIEKDSKKISEYIYENNYAFTNKLFTDNIGLYYNAKTSSINVNAP